jgi:hypothetical protein
LASVADHSPGAELLIIDFAIPFWIKDVIPPLSELSTITTLSELREIELSVTVTDALANEAQRRRAVTKINLFINISLNKSNASILLALANVMQASCLPG